MRRVVVSFLLTALLIPFFGCAGNPGGPAIEVTITNAFSSIQAAAAPVVLTAVVMNYHKNAGLKWSLTLAGVACSPACGTLEVSPKPGMTATYTPPKTPPQNTTATISAFSARNNSSNYVFNFTILPAVGVMITNKFPSIIVSSPAVTLNATVTNDPAMAGVTWTLTAGGSNCSPACGTLTPMPAPPAASFSATYTPPTVVPMGANASPTIMATSVTESTESDSFSFMVLPITAAFNGQYAILLRGYAQPNSPMAIAGAFTADGMGNITNAEFDIDNDGGITPIPFPQKGNYTINNSFNGVIQGTVSITSFTFPNGFNLLSFQFVLTGDLSQGQIIEFDGTGYINAGKIYKQDPNAVGTLPVNSFAFGLDSDAPIGGRTVEDGQFVIAQGGGVTGLVDQSKAANLVPQYSGAAIGVGSTATPPDQAGRGTLVLVVQGKSTLYAYYIVNASQLELIETDMGLTFGTAQAGVARAQKLPFSASTVDTGASVLQMTGMDVSSVTQAIGPDVIIGVLSLSNEQFFNLTFDSNDLGQLLTEHPAIGTITSFDPTTGRGQITVPGGFQTGFVNTAVFYLWDAGDGFIIDADPSTTNAPPNQAVTNNAFSGTFVTQMSPVNLDRVSGNALGLFGGSAIPDIPNLEITMNVTSGTGTYTALGNLASLDSQVGNSPNVSFDGNISVTDFVLGHGTATFPSGVFGNFSSSQFLPGTFYIIGPNNFVYIGQENGQESGVAFFESQ